MRQTCIVLFLGLFCLVVNAQEGAWRGILNFQNTKLPIVFHFEADGCRMDSPAQDAIGIPAIKSYTKEGVLQIVVPMIGASFLGAVDGDSIVGTFLQAGVKLPLVLKLSQDKPIRPQTPRPPFPYEIQEVSFKNDDFIFHGTLTLPKRANKNTPILVMVTGSGLQDRNEEIFQHQPFAVIADALARHGIATYRYDDRGWGNPNYNINNGSILDYRDDAEAAVKHIQKKFRHVGVLGHSEGATIALMLASERKVDFCVSLAGMVVSGKETLLYQNKMVLSTQNFSQEVVEEYCTTLSRVLDAIITDTKIESINNRNIPKELMDNLMLVQNELPNSRYFQDLIKTDIRSLLSKVQCPVLAINGTLDTQIDCEYNLVALDNGLVNSQHNIVYYQGLNHLLQHCRTGLSNEYLTIEETISPDVLQNIINWVMSITKKSAE